MVDVIRQVSRIAGAISLVLLLTGCTTTISPPPVVHDPVTVFILDHGRHSSLVLPHPEGMTRYAYGEWQWYAEVNTGPLRAFAVLFWPTQATLGRRALSSPATEEGVRRSVGVGIERLHRVQVEAGAVAALRAEFDALHRAQLGSARFNADYNLVFVHHPDPYILWHNSNHVTAQWLRRLGCTTRGFTFWSIWEVESP